MFPIFFGSDEAPGMLYPGEDLSPEDAQKLAEGLRQSTEQLRKMMERLAKGDLLSREEMEKLARMVGLNQMDNLNYREWMVQRMKKALQFREVQEALKELAETLAELGMDRQKAQQISQMMQANQQALEDQLRQFAGQKIAENISNRPPDDGIDALMNRPFNTLSDRDMDRLRQEVKRLATTLKTRVALRQKRAKSGQLDAKATIRANMKNASVPIEVKHREHTLKPKLVLICDVSTSMRYISELMLSLLFHMQDMISKTSAFAFISHLEYISPDFSTHDVSKAVGQVLERMPAGYYNTDLGASLADFQNGHLALIDSHTTLIVVGDGRNNYNEPRIDIWNILARRARRTIWLNPEAPALWGNGDSDMLKYASACDVVLQANNLAQLTAAVDRMLLA
jgi:uncharacterized protein with von Willebrand factor type A (vWA) domain